MLLSSSQPLTKEEKSPSLELMYSETVSFVSPALMARTVISSERSAAIFATDGSSLTHGGHHVAQK